MTARLGGLAAPSSAGSGWRGLSSWAVEFGVFTFILMLCKTPVILFLFRGEEGAGYSPLGGRFGLSREPQERSVCTSLAGAASKAPQGEGKGIGRALLEQGLQG